MAKISKRLKPITNRVITSGRDARFGSQLIRRQQAVGQAVGQELVESDFVPSIFVYNPRATSGHSAGMLHNVWVAVDSDRAIRQGGDKIYMVTPLQESPVLTPFKQAVFNGELTWQLTELDDGIPLAGNPPPPDDLYDIIGHSVFLSIVPFIEGSLVQALVDGVPRGRLITLIYD